MKKLMIIILLFTCFSLTSYSQETTKQKPKATYKVGSANIAMWVNTKKDGTTWKSFKVEKNYQTKDGEWKSTNTFSESELLELKAAIDKAIAEQNIKAKTTEGKK